MNIREYKPEDRSKVEELVAQLQDYEGEMVSNMIPGKDMAQKYFDKTLQNCSEKSGKVFVAEDEDKIVGFISGWKTEEDWSLVYTEPIRTFFYIADTFVLEEYRGQGVGKMLFAKIEEHAKSIGVNQLKITATGMNLLARDVYRNLGFEEAEVILVKDLK